MASASGIRAGQAFVELFADDRRLIQGLRAASKRLKDWGQNVTAMGQRILAAGTAAMGGAFAASGVFASMGDEMAKASQRTGISVERLSELAYAADQSGADLATLESGVRRMQKSIAEAAGGSASAQESLAQLGLTAQRLANLSPDQQFTLIADRLAKIANPAQRAAAAMELFGRSGTQLLPMIAGGAAGIEALAERARQLGLVMSTEDAKAAVVFGDLLSDLWKSVKMGVFAIGLALAPTLTEWVQRAMVVMKGLADWVRENKALVVSAFKVAVAVAAGGAALIAFGGAMSFVGATMASAVMPLRLVGTALQAIFVAASIASSGMRAVGVASGVMRVSLGTATASAKTLHVVLAGFGAAANIAVAALRGVGVATLAMGGVASGVIRSLAAGAVSAPVVAMRILAGTMGMVRTSLLATSATAQIVFRSAASAIRSAPIVALQAFNAALAGTKTSVQAVGATSLSVFRCLASAVRSAPVVALRTVNSTVAGVGGAIKAVTSSISAFGGALRALGPLDSVLRVLPIAASALLSPLALATVAVVGLGAAVIHLAGGWRAAVAKITALMRSLAGALRGVWNGIISSAAAAWDTIVSTASNAWGGVYKTAAAAISWTAGLFVRIQEAAAWAWKKVQEGGAWLAGAIQSVFSSAAAWMGTKFTALKDAAVTVWRDIAATASAAWQGIGDALAAGDLSLAAKIFWLTLKVEWQKGIAWLSGKWSDFKESFLSVATEAVYGAAKIFTTAWAGLQTAWVETVAFLTKTWARFTAGVVTAWRAAQNWIAKKFVALMGYLDSSLDVEATQRILDEDFAREQRQHEQATQAQLRGIEETRQAKRRAIDDEQRGTGEVLEQERQRKQAERQRQTDADLQAAQEAVDAAKKEWQAALEEAARKRAEIPPAEAAQDAAYGGTMEGIDVEGVARRVSLAGTFNALAAGGLGSGSTLDRVARASEDTARNTKRLVQHIQTGGLTFA